MKKMLFSLFLLALLFFLAVNKHESDDFEKLNTAAVSAFSESPAFVEVFSLEGGEAVET